jgi:protein-histidine N-methyltransferase
MSFSFGFTADSDDEFTENSTTTTHQPQPFVNPLDTVSQSAYLAQELSVSDLLQSLKDTRVTFETYVTPFGNAVFRRELFDVKHQLMTEDNGEDQDDEYKILIGSDSTDLKKNIYEGGLKSWECSIDTVDHLCHLGDDEVFKGKVVELGCGTALPSTYLFNRALRSNKAVDFILSDYNQSVLRLVTIPNLIITWASTLEPEELIQLQRSDDEAIPIVPDELQFTGALLGKFSEALVKKSIGVRLVAGSWSRKFVEIIEDSSPIGLIITSETIYAPDTLPVISELVIELLIHSKNSGQQPLALVAAKDIYFGVGGSLVEFEQYLTRRQEQCVQIEFIVRKVEAGLKRSIVLIK